MPSSVVIIGIGNLLRGDDGVGIAVARELKRHLAGTVQIIEEAGDGLRLLEVWRQASSVFVVDAMSSGTAPGTIRVFDVHKHGLPLQFFPCSTHAFGLPHAIELARALKQIPPKFLVFGMEGQSFELGSPISNDVIQAVERVVTSIRKELNRHI